MDHIWSYTEAEQVTFSVFAPSTPIEAEPEEFLLRGEQGLKPIQFFRRIKLRGVPV